MNGLATIALAWKEFRQLIGITLAISICAILGFAIAGLMENVIPFDNPLKFFYSIVPATLTPITIAMAGAVIAVGGERQAGNWQWMTTLPVTWTHAFITKLAITILMAFGAGAFVFGVTFAISSVGGTPLSYELGLDGYDYRLMLFAVPIALLWAIIMCLCLREPMIAIMIAAAVTLFQGFIKNLILSEFVSASAPTDFGMMSIATAIETSALSLIALLGFRAGWFNSEPILAGVISAGVSDEELAAQTRWGTWSRPNSIWAMLWQSLQAQIWPVAAIGLLTLISYPLLGFHAETLFFQFSLVLPCFLGIFTLAGEQTRRQFRVIADRGLSPRRYLLVRTLIPFALITFVSLVLIPILTTSIRPQAAPIGDWKAYFLLYGTALGVYLSFVFATLTFSNPMLALFAGIAVVFSIGYGIASPVFAGGWLGLWVAIPLTLIAVALPWLLVKRWMRFENAKLPAISFVSILAICLSSGLFYAPMRAYSVPKIQLPPINASLPFASLPGNVTNINLDKAYYESLLISVDSLDHNLPGYTTLLEQLKPLASAASEFGAGATMDDMGSMSAGEPLPPAEAGTNNEPTPSPVSQETAMEQLKQKLDALKSAIQSPRNENISLESWHYNSNGTDVAEWLSMVIYYAMVKEDREMLAKAVDAYASFIDPRYPIEFSLYNEGAFISLANSLRQLRGSSSPEMFAIVFDRLSENVPNPELWSNYYLALTDANNSMLVQNHRFYNRFFAFGYEPTMSIMVASERERVNRILALQALANIYRCTPIINAMAQTRNVNQTNRSKDSNSFERTIPDSNANLSLQDSFYLSGNTEIDAIMLRYYSQQYGTMSYYPMPHSASQNLVQYFQILMLSASGTVADKE